MVGDPKTFVAIVALRTKNVRKSGNTITNVAIIQQSNNSAIRA